MRRSRSRGEDYYTKLFGRPTWDDGGYFVWQFGDSGIAFGALHAPVTMLLPTAAFIFVPIFIIVLGPIAIRVFSGTLL